MSGPSEPPTPPAKVNVWPTRPGSAGYPSRPDRHQIGRTPAPQQSPARAHHPAAQHTDAQRPAAQHQALHQAPVSESLATEPSVPASEDARSKIHLSRATQIWIGIAVLSLLILIVSFFVWDRPVADQPAQQSTAQILNLR